MDPNATADATPTKNLVRRAQLEIERAMVSQALAEAGTVAGAARALGMARSKIYVAVQRHGLTVPGHWPNQTR